jgi:sugar phosphate isomerase/epimerase
MNTTDCDSGDVFVSSGAFGGMTVEDILDSAFRERIFQIELASGTRHSGHGNLLRTLELARDRGYAFLIHNYFPVPETPFVLNLASADPANLGRSERHARNAIDLAAAVGSPFYSVHCGFCIDPAPTDLGGTLNGPAIPVDDAMATFVCSARRLADYAESKGVRLLFENNVLSPANAGKVRLLGVTPGEIEDLLKRINRPNVGLLLDVGHLKVSANTMGFDMVAAAAQVAPYVHCCHLSDNDGRRDSNEVVTATAWFWKPLLSHLQSAPVWVLEAYNLPLQIIANQIALIEAQVA